jgi:hypothetical protein
LHHVIAGIGQRHAVTRKLAGDVLSMIPEAIDAICLRTARRTNTTSKIISSEMDDVELKITSLLGLPAPDRWAPAARCRAKRVGQPGKDQKGSSRPDLILASRAWASAMIRTMEDVILASFLGLVSHTLGASGQRSSVNAGEPIGW